MQRCMAYLKMQVSSWRFAKLVPKQQSIGSPWPPISQQIRNQNKLGSPQYRAIILRPKWKDTAFHVCGCICLLHLHAGHTGAILHPVGGLLVVFRHVWALDIIAMAHPVRDTDLVLISFQVPRKTRCLFGFLQGRLV